MSKHAKTDPASGHIEVWDISIRLFHWTLVLSILVAGLTGFVLGASWLRLHIAAATLAAALVAGRLVWGFLGPTFARFSGFVVLHPFRLLGHMHDLRADRAPRYLGHNPLGGAMVVALMAAILALGLTGMGALGGMLKTGPFVDDLSYQFGLTSNFIHYFLAIGLVGLVILHIGGVIFESLRERENLARAMVTGKKAVRAGDVAALEKPARVWPAITLAALLIGGFGYMAFLSSQEKPTSAPVAEASFDSVFADECSACHMLYHPSLLPAADWKTLIAGLEDHFGEDASLDPQSTTRILDWLVANAAETTDTRPAHLFTLPVGQDGTIAKISDTGAWQDLHDDALESGMFEVKSVASRDNCKACHADVESGMFSPFNIEIPKE